MPVSEPVICSSVLAVRPVLRFGETLTTSLRLGRQAPGPRGWRAVAGDYLREVQDGSFPAPEHSADMDPELLRGLGE